MHACIKARAVLWRFHFIYWFESKRPIQIGRTLHKKFIINTWTKRGRSEDNEFIIMKGNNCSRYHFNFYHFDDKMTTAKTKCDQLWNCTKKTVRNSFYYHKECSRTPDTFSTYERFFFISFIFLYVNTKFSVVKVCLFFFCSFHCSHSSVLVNNKKKKKPNTKNSLPIRTLITKEQQTRKMQTVSYRCCSNEIQFYLAENDERPKKIHQDQERGHEWNVHIDV